MRIVVLGTGTDVGKTYVTVSLCRQLSAQYQTCALKPVESGYTRAATEHGAQSPNSDAARLAAVSTHPVHGRGPLIGLSAPISPHLAAAREGVSIELSEIVAWVERTEAQLPPGALVLIETAGGALSPLNERQTNSDLALALAPSFNLLVAPDHLGVLHDLRATTLALGTLPLAIDALVLSTPRPPDPSTGTNAGEISRLGIAEPLATVAHGATLQLGAVVGAIATWPQAPRKARGLPAS